MSRLRRFELIKHTPFLPPFLVDEQKETSSLYCHYSTNTHFLNPFYYHLHDFTLDLLNPCYSTIHVEKTPLYTSTRRVHHQVDPLDLPTGLLFLQSLSDRVSALESSFDRLADEKKKSKSKIGERKYTCTAEIKPPEEDDWGFDRKYKWTAEIKDGKTNGHLDKNFKYTAEIKGKGLDSPISRKYNFTAATGDAGESSGSFEKEKKEKDKKKNKSEKEKLVSSTRLVEIHDEPSNHGALVLRQAFARRVEKLRGKRKELSPEDAAMKIQVCFKAYLIRRSQALRALRELAIAKSKLREIRALFNNFSYRRRLSRDAEERQRFSENIIVLLLTVDAIEGSDMLVRAAKKSMVDELEAMLDVVDPQPGGRSLPMTRRTFDMPDPHIQKELAAGVAQVVQILDEEATDS